MTKILFGKNLSNEEITRLTAIMEENPFLHTIIIPNKENEPEIIGLYQERTIAILRAFLECDPFFQSDYEIGAICCFCNNFMPNHNSDCPYIQAEQLIKEFDNGRPSTKIP